MKSIIIAITLISTNVFAGDIVRVGELYCAREYANGVAISCVTSASIEKDKVELEVARLKLQQLKEEIAEKNTKRLESVAEAKRLEELAQKRKRK